MGLTGSKLSSSSWRTLLLNASHSNPNAGKLAAQANRPAKFAPEPRQEERLVVCHRASTYPHLLTISLVGLIYHEPLGPSSPWTNPAAVTIQ